MNGREKQLEHFLTVGRLRERIKDLPDDAPVFIERVEDSYFEPGSGWIENAVFKPGEVPGYQNCFVQAYGTYRYQDDDSLYITPHY